MSLNESKGHQIPVNFVFFNMELSDILAGAALLVSIIFAVRSERRENKRRNEDQKVSLRIELKRHSSYSKLKIMEGKSAKIPFNYFFLNDGMKDIYLKHLKFEAFYDDKWHTLQKIDYYNKKSESRIVPGPRDWKLINQEFSPDLLQRITEIHFIIHIETTLGQTFTSNMEELPPFQYFIK